MTNAGTHGTMGPRIGVIGAGPCGITTIKNLLAAGLRNIVCYDEREAIGGNWVFTEAGGQSSVYETTHLISSRRLSQFEDYPMPTDYPDFPSHRQMRAYFESYARHFGVLDHVRLQTRVERGAATSDGRWRLRLSSPSGVYEEVYDYLIVCSGHHHAPLLPTSTGHFEGESLHSVGYKRATPFAGKRVLVVGGGNSACDIAAEISGVAARTCISMRRPYWLLPKRVLGQPIDTLYQWLRLLPRSLIPMAARAGASLIVGSWSQYGLQPPQAGPLTMHPTLNTTILAALRQRRVEPRPGIERLDGSCVRFVDGTCEDFDTIIWATGFRIVFPFFDDSVIDWDTATTPPLYLRMMHRRQPNLFFIGLFQPIGCIWRLADHQARIAALQIAGRLRRPPDIDARIEHDLQAPHWQFDATPRHATEVDPHDFRRELLGHLAEADRIPSAAD